MTTVATERNRKILQELVTHRGNDTCADCKANAPRWASYNLGIFICVSCASIHRKIGTHITKVKSITLDSWTKEQTENMKQIGNIKSNSIYNPNELKHPPPANLMDGERDSELEKYIRAKYEFKRFVDKSASSSRSVPLRAQSTPLDMSGNVSASPVHPNAKPDPSQIRAVSQPVQLQPQQPLPQIQQQQQGRQQTQQQQPQQSPQPAPAVNKGNKDGIWADLISLQTSTSSLPLQYQTPQSLSQQSLSNNTPVFINPGMSGSSHISYQPPPQLAIPPYSGLMPSFPSSFPSSSSPSFANSPISFQSPLPMHSQIHHTQQFVQSPNIAQPLAQNGFPAQQTVMPVQFLPPSPQPMVTSTTPQFQSQILTPSPQPQFMPQTYPNWPQPGMQGFGSTSM